MLQLATTVVCPHQLKPSNRHTSCPGSRAGTPVCQRANPAVTVVRYSWCRAGGFIRAAVGGVCVLAMWLQVGLSQAQTTSIPRLPPKKTQNIAKVRIPTYAIFWYVRTTYSENILLCCCSHINSQNVRGRRTGSSHSGAEEYPREKHTQPKVVHAYITADAIHASTRNI